MSSVKYIGLDVHLATIVVAVVDDSGKLIVESVLETRAATILDFIGGLRGKLMVALEEGISADWLYSLLKPHVAYIIVCDARKSSRMKAGSKSDKIDARQLAELLRAGQLSSVYHGDVGVRTLRELARSYMSLTQDLTRVMNRIKSIYHSQAIRCPGQHVYSPLYRTEWLEQLKQPGQRHRAELLHAQFDLIRPLRQQARQALLTESQRFPVRARLQEIPFLGPIRAALLIATIQSPHRFRTKRLLWAYSGLAVETHSSADYTFDEGRPKRSKKVSIRGLNDNHNRELKYLFKSMAMSASIRPGPLRDFYERLLAKGIKPSLARLTLARKIAAIVLVIWKKGGSFDPEKLTMQAA
ncbi:MAG TPA: transposase [candidate division Zixibacteria bacterium]|nr:transposase [candidate division Zixibacteria bacterium]